MANVSLSPRIKKLVRDFAVKAGQYRMSDAKHKGWLRELEKVPEGERPDCAAELIALALRFEREGGEGAAMGAAQLYVLAAGLVGKVAKTAKAGGWAGAATKARR